LGHLLLGQPVLVYFGVLVDQLVDFGQGIKFLQAALLVGFDVILTIKRYVILLEFLY
jgi:hypothetical protein